MLLSMQTTWIQSHTDMLSLQGDGVQKLELFKLAAEKKLRELLADIQFAGCQHFGFKEFLDLHGNRLRLLTGHSNGSVSFQLAQIRVGADKVPVQRFFWVSAWMQHVSSGASPFV
jgi:hypothetical protein